MREVVRFSPHVQDFIVLGQGDIFEILTSREPTQALARCILTQVDMAVVSPFVISGPVPERMFFGREAEVKLLVENTCKTDFAVIGNRKIGKTSLLKRSQARLSAGKAAKPLLVDCQTVRDTNGVFDAFVAQTGIGLPSLSSDSFGAVLSDLHQDGSPVIIFMDEVDALLANEKLRGEQLAAAWRSLAQAGICHFVFCGSTGLARRLDDPSSVFFNFAQPLILGYLSSETFRQVLTQPMETLGIILEDQDALLAEAVALTSGHPNLIQYVGKSLVEAANRRQERRVLFSDIVALSTSTDFTDFYLKTIWGEAGPLEKLITLVAPDGSFQVGDIEKALLEQEVSVSDEELDAALKLLRIYMILEKQEKSYTFVPRAFHEILHRTQEVDRLMGFEKRRLAERGT